MIHAGRPKYHTIFYKYVIVKNKNGTVSCFDIRKSTMITKDDEIILEKKDRVQTNASLIPISVENEKSIISRNKCILPHLNNETSTFGNKDHLITSTNKSQTQIKDFDLTSEQINDQNNIMNYFECFNHFDSSIDIIETDDLYTENLDFEIFTDNINLNDDAFNINEQEPIQ